MDSVRASVRIDAPLSARQEFFERQCLHHELFFCTRIPEVLGSKFETSCPYPLEILFPVEVTVLKGSHQWHEADIQMSIAFTGTGNPI